MWGPNSGRKARGRVLSPPLWQVVNRQLSQTKRQIWTSKSVSNVCAKAAAGALAGLEIRRKGGIFDIFRSDRAPGVPKREIGARPLSFFLA